MNEFYNALDRYLRNDPNGVHIYATALMGKTAYHLKTEHKITPGASKEENARLHIEAHRVNG